MTSRRSWTAAQTGLTINRDAFLADREALMDRFGIAAEDWLGMVRRGNPTLIAVTMAERSAAKRSLRR